MPEWEVKYAKLLHMEALRTTQENVNSFHCCTKLILLKLYLMFASFTEPSSNYDLATVNRTPTPEPGTVLLQEYPYAYSAMNVLIVISL